MGGKGMAGDGWRLTFGGEILGPEDSGPGDGDTVDKKITLERMWSEKVFTEKRHFAIFCSLLKNRLGWADRDIGRWFGKEAFNRMANSVASLPKSQISSLITEFQNAFPYQDLKRLYRNISVSVVGRGRLPKGVTKTSNQRDIVDSAIDGSTTVAREYAMLRAFILVDGECEGNELLSLLTAQVIFSEVITRLSLNNREIAQAKKALEETLCGPDGADEVIEGEKQRKRRLDI